MNWQFWRTPQPAPEPEPEPTLVAGSPLGWSVVVEPVLAVTPADRPAERFCAITRYGGKGAPEYHSLCGAGAQGMPPKSAPVTVRSGHWVAC